MTFEEWWEDNKEDIPVGSKHATEMAWNAAIDSVDGSLEHLADAGGDIAWYKLDHKLTSLRAS